MADYDSGLPIRTQADGTDERVHVKVVDGTNPAVNQMQVDADKAAKVLATGHDPGGVNRTVRLSEIGALTPDGLYDAANNTKPGNLGQILATRGASPGDSSQNLRRTGIHTGTVNAADVSLFDNNGNPYTVTNPLPVSIDTNLGTTVDDFKDAASIAAAASDNHDYTVTAGKTLYLNQIESTGSGKAKMVVAIETGVATGVFTTKFTQFNSTADSNMSIKLEDAIPVAAGVRVRVTMTNRDNQAQDLYSTICGHEQ